MTTNSTITPERKLQIEDTIAQLSYEISKKHWIIYLTVGSEDNVRDEKSSERYSANRNTPVIKNSIVASFYNPKENPPEITQYDGMGRRRYGSPNDMKINVIYNYRAGDLIEFSCTRNWFEDYSMERGEIEMSKTLFNFDIRGSNIATLVEAFDKCNDYVGNWGGRRKINYQNKYR